MKHLYNKFFKLGVLLFLFLFLSNEAFASHVSGGYFQFQCLGGGKYKVSLILYRDCSGISMDNTVTVNFNNNCGLGNKSIVLGNRTFFEVTQVCAADAGNTVCKGGTVHGYQQYTYSAVVDLSAYTGGPNCDGWNFSYDLCCRNSTVNVNNSSSTDFYITSKLNTATMPCNTTPTVTGQPQPYVCVGQSVIYNPGVSEPDGNTISYSLVPVTNTGGTSVTYNAPYSATNPINGASIDPVSGTVTYTPNTTGAFIFVIQMTEKNASGQVVSVTNYEYQTFVVACANQQPTVAPTDPNDPSNPFPGGVSNVSGSMIQTGQNSIKMCQGLQGCFDVLLKDLDAGNSISIKSTNLSSVMPGATITQTGSNPRRLHICWTPATASGIVTLNFLIEDNACPLPGQTSVAITVEVIVPGTSTVSTTPEVCSGNNDGKATITVTGGPAASQYQITGPTNATNTTGVFTNLKPGAYNYTVSTVGGSCPLSGTFTIGSGATVSLTPSHVDVTCNGNTDGSATATPSGGTPTYTYTWSQGGTPIGQTTQTASNIAAGTYDVLVTDSKGCTQSVSIVVAQPNPLAGSLNPTNVTCFGGATGQLSVTGVSGGTTPYQYSIDGGAYSAPSSFTGLSSGPHVVNVKDSKGCILTLNGNITQPTKLTPNLVSTGSTTCGSNSGNFTVGASGGTSPYQYTLGGTTNSTGIFTNVPAGANNVVVTDANGCTQNLSVTVGATPVPTAYLDSKTDLSCFGGNNGAAVIGVNNAVGTVSYVLDGGSAQASNVFNGLTQGNHTVTMTDANGCTSTVNFTINQPPIISISSTPFSASCNGVCDGKINVTASGGTGTFTYSSDGGSVFGAASTLTGLCSGNVFVVVKDANGCIANATVPITQPGALNANFVGTDPVCSHGTNGFVTVNSVTGGTPTFQYNIDGSAFQGSNVLNGLSAGNHTVIVKDANGCQFSGNVTLANPPGINLVTDSVSPSNCHFSNGSITIHGVGSNPPFQYAITSAATDPIVYQGGTTFSNKVAGAYKIYIKDNLGCVDSAFVGINDVEMDGELLDSTNLTCYESNDGTVDVINHAGLAPITFEMDNNPSSQQTNGSFMNLPAGNHIVTIYDKGFCVYTIPFVLTQPDSIDFDANILDVACNGGSTGVITVKDTIGGNGMYQFSMDGGATLQTTPFTGLPTGDYQVMVFDQNYCTATRNFHIDQADVINFTENVVDLTCNNDNSGSIQIIGVTGGSGAYNYSINGGTPQAVPVFTGLAAGTYTLTVGDASVAGCSISKDTTITEPSVLTATYTPKPTTCFDTCNGGISIVANGGTPTYLYSLDGGTTYSSNATLTNLCANSYNVTVKDNHGCIITSPSVVVTQPTQITYSTDSIPSTCTNANGQINVVNVNGGTPGYSYSINNGAYGTSTSFTGLAAANSPFTISVKDANNCIITTTQDVTDQPSPTINVLQGTDPLCNGDANGQIEVTATGGTGVLQYSVDGGAYQTSNILTGLTQGNHTVTIQDANGCTDAKNITLNEPPVLTMTSTATNLTCFQNSTGKINVVANGGTPVYQYSFDNGTTYSSSPDDIFIPAGTYNIVVKDNHGCQVTGTQVVTEPPILAFGNIVTDSTLCKSSCDGSIQLTMTGGTGVYSYTWDQSVAGNVSTANNLCTGTYTFSVKDANGCQVDSSAFIGEPDSVQISNIVSNFVACAGACTGSIEMTSPTATQFSIDNGTTFQASNQFTNVCAGNYQLVAKDANGCIVKRNTEVWQPDSMHLVMPNDTLVCNAYNYSGAVQPSGGIQPYTYNWTNTSSTSDSLNIIVTSTQTYTLTLTDVNGCTIPSDSVKISVIPLVDIKVLQDTTICPGSSVQLSAQGLQGKPNYSYSWSNGDSTNVINVSPTANSTTYLATVTDQCGDTKTDSVIVKLHQLPQVIFTADKQTGCLPLTVHFTNTTNPGMIGTNCVWTIDGQTVTGCSGIDYTFNSAKCYDINLKVTSPDGCANDTTFTNYVCVDDYPVANFNYSPKDPTILDNQVNFTNLSVGAETYLWNFQGYGSSSQENPIQVFPGINGGDILHICLQATSQYGCKDTTCQDITFKDIFSIYVPNTFTPDGDLFNNVFKPVLPPNTEATDYHLMIFDRWGELIFESYDYNVGWDGTYGGKMCQDGTYVWKISLKLDAKGTKDFVGHVTLLR